MTPLDCALAYAESFGWRVFPCHATGPKRKQPHILDQHGQASTRRRSQGGGANGPLR